MRSFEYTCPQKITKVRMEKIGKDYWQYTLRHVLPCNESKYSWIEVTDIIVNFSLDEKTKCVSNIRGIRRTWQDINYHTITKYRLDPELWDEPRAYEKYKRECKCYSIDSLLDGEIPEYSRPEVEDLEKELCKVVIRTFVKNV